MTPAALWDVDGTLVDTAELHFRAWSELARREGWAFDRAIFGAGFGRRNPEIIRTFFAPDATDAQVAELGEAKEVLYRAATERHGVDLLPGVAELLAGLAAAGWRQAVASSAPRGNLDLLLRLTGTAHYFGAVVSAEDVARGKPDPEVFQVAASKLGVPTNRCVVLEDAVAGVESATAAGMPCVAVTFVKHHPAEKLRAAGAARVVASLADVSAADLAALLG